MLTAVLADYASDEHRGKISGLVGLSSGSGALLALFVFLRLPAQFNDGPTGLHATYLIVAGIAILFSLGLLLSLRKQNYDPVSPSTPSPIDTSDPRITSSASLISESVTTNTYRGVNTSSEESGLNEFDSGRRGKRYYHGLDVNAIWESLKMGVLAGRDPKVFLGYLGSFLARGDTIIITLFLPLWVYKAYIDRGDCQAPSPDAPDIKDICRSAYVRASALSGVAQTFALVGAPFFGWLTDKIYAPYTSLFASLIGFIGYGLMFFINPLSPSTWPVVILVGLGEIGMIIGNLSLVTSSASVSPGLRGSVAGVSSACGAFGILVSSKLGGYLFDVWREGAPFLVMALGHLVALGVAIVCVLVGRREGAKRGEDVEAVGDRVGGSGDVRGFDRDGSGDVAGSSSTVNRRSPGAR
ncbi:hypothetical protein HDU76_010524, partial [Blyttiomyces sp. JEL0837]